MNRSMPFVLLLAACTDGSGKESSTDSALPEISVLGEGDGSPGSVAWTYILGTAEKLDDPRDLGFDASGNLWIANRRDDRTFIVSNPGSSEQDYERRKEGAAEHFMEEIAALSFDTGTQFAACGETNNTYNGQAPGNDYMGPVLYSTDLNIFGVENPIGLGSHLDMAHESPFCVGIAWETANVYWLFDGEHSAIVRNDFQADHGIGMDEHYDTIVHRLSEPEVTRVPEAPGHMVFEAETKILYVADTGGGRILWVDTTTGSEGKNYRNHDPGVVNKGWDGAEWGIVVDGLDKPGGLAMVGDHLIVGEWGSGILKEVDLNGKEVRRLDTGFGAERLYGIELGPDGQLWVTDKDTGVYRIDP